MLMAIWHDKGIRYDDIVISLWQRYRARNLMMISQHHYGRDISWDILWCHHDIFMIEIPYNVFYDDITISLRQKYLARYFAALRSLDDSLLSRAAPPPLPSILCKNGCHTVLTNYAGRKYSLSFHMQNISFVKCMLCLRSQLRYALKGIPNSQNLC